MHNLKKYSYVLKNSIGKLSGKRFKDDFDWKLYNVHYRGELDHLSKSLKLKLDKNDYVFEDGELKKSDDAILPLHPNWRLLYETILQLSPKSVFELGSGGGDHLSNLSVLDPGIELNGADISADQIDLLRERHPGMNAEISEFDCTLPFPHNMKNVDVAYTQAVIMHIQTGNGHRVALSNLFELATRQVVLMENWSRHDFLEDIQMLHKSRILSWEEVHFYYRESPELKKPHLMVISATPLDTYPELNDYSILRGQK